MSSSAQAAVVAVRPRVLAVATATPTRALALAGLAGAGMSVQAFLNGRLGGHLHSVAVAASVNNVVGLLGLATLALASGSVGRARARLRRGAGLRLWQFTGGAMGAAVVSISTAAAPRVGVAMLTVALVAGQTTGSLGVDASGLSPSGRHGVTPARALGVALAIAAVAASALGAHGEPQLGLLALALGAGGLFALQQAVNGRLAGATGEPSLAALANFAVGFVVLGTVALLVTAGHGARWSAPVQDWLGGLLGAFFVVVSAAAVRSLGVLRLMLVIVAGQSAGALLVDLAWPAGGESVTPGTVVAVALTLVAVAVSGRAGARAAPR